MPRRRRLVPYWLRSEGEICACCGTTHASAVTIHCAGCDRHHCAVCVVTVGDEHFCQDCDEERRRR